MSMQTVDHTEIQKFSDLSESWWDHDGPFKHLHLMNRVRTQYIQNILNAEKAICGHRLTDLELLDVGCGGGILSISMSRLGAKVTGVDISHDNIVVARSYADSKGCDVNYVESTAEALVADEKCYDIVCAMEIVEHVADIKIFLESIIKLVKKDGFVFISTINKTVKSYLQAKFLAEYILRIVPVGTHDWDKFVKPSDIAFFMRDRGCRLLDIKGMKYNILNNAWSLSHEPNVNYIMALQKL